MSSTQKMGHLGEDRACRYLKQQGLKLLTRNFSCKLGEIDLIMQAQDATIVFVEVRWRQLSRYGTGLDTVTWTKQQRLIRTAHIFLSQRRHYSHRPCRFDVVSIDGNAIEWIKDAFEA